MLDIPITIADKTQMYALLNRGLLGNTARVFSSLEEAETFSGLVNIRSRQKSGKGFLYGIAPKDLRARSQEFVRDGVTELQYNEAMPDDLLTIQGEICQDVDRPGYYLRYDTTPLRNMRQAMANCRHAHGLNALMLLKGAMTGADYDDIIELFDYWPDAVIEFSTYSVAVGSCRGRNTVIWEVRTGY